MADLYNIKGDTGHPWRLHKFLETLQETPYADTTFLTAFVNNQHSSLDEMILLAWYHSLLYSEISAVYLLKHLDFFQLNPKTLKAFWDSKKSDLEASSFRVYVKNNDWFVPLMKTFIKKTKKQPARWFKSLVDTCIDPKDRFNAIYSEVNSWKYMGRLSTEAFLWTLEDLSYQGLFPWRLDSPTYYWGKGSNETSGLLNVLYLDEEANEFDKTGKLPHHLYPILDEGLVEVQKELKRLYPKQNADFKQVSPRLCSFRNLFKSNRYMGYHYDRQLSQIIKMRDSKTCKDSKLYDLCFKLRKQVFPKRFLGELNGWSGIRKERKTLFIKQGLTGCEPLKGQLLINIRGANGAGKSTALIQMRESDPEMFEVVKPVGGKPKIIATVYPSYGIVALGKYSNKCGGVDSFKGNEMVEKALKYIIKTYPTYTIVMEGIIVSTIYQTYADLFTNLKVKHGLNTKILFLMPTLDVCLKRVYQRNGGKAIKEDSVAQKYRTMERGISKFKADGFSVDVVDNSNWAKEDTLDNFLSLIEKYKEELI